MRKVRTTAGSCTGRDRRAASAAERARVNVPRAIKAALVRIREHSPDLHHHLRLLHPAGGVRQD
ncbi:MAG TPA: hypothetical protein VGX21_06920 [Methylomirabilota bacterium]|nr:hypothetical protein [Methylomirabilota bacterium]